MHVSAKSNEYADLLGDRLLDAMPKAVLAAICVAALCGDELDTAKRRVIREWQILHLNGIVPQRPSRTLLARIGKE